MKMVTVSYVPGPGRPEVYLEAIDDLGYEAKLSPIESVRGMQDPLEHRRVDLARAEPPNIAAELHDPVERVARRVVEADGNVAAHSPTIA